MADETLHLVHTYRNDGPGGRPCAMGAVVTGSPEAAAARAERIYATGRYDGVAAYTATRKPGEKVYGHHQVHARLGDVPDYGGDEG